MKKVLLAVVVLAVVYGLVVLAFAFDAARKNAAFRAQLDHLVQLGDRVVPSLEATPEQSLVEACKTLPEVEPKLIAAYFAKTSAEVKELTFLPNRAIQSTGETVDWPWFERDIVRFSFDLLSDFPLYWPNYLERWNSPFNHDFADTKYLLVHLLVDLRLPFITGEETYQAGLLTFHSAVVDAQTGKVLCTGSTEVSPRGEIHVYGRGKTTSDAEADAQTKRQSELIKELGFAGSHFGLGELCWLGGEGLCSMTFREYVHPR